HGKHASPEERARLKREMTTLGSLRHEHIVQIHAAGEHDGYPYFAMELLDGGTLAHELQRQAKTVRAAAELVEILARAVHAVHQEGVVHRDLKPANVLLTADGRPKITDFGLVRPLQGEGTALTPSAAVVGTYEYMAP